MKSIIFLKTLIGKDMEFAKYRIENNDGSHPQFKKLDRCQKSL